MKLSDLLRRLKPARPPDAPAAAAAPPAEAALNWFGKLPVYGDYYDGAARDAAHARLVGWLDSGLAPHEQSLRGHKRGAAFVDCVGVLSWGAGTASRRGGLTSLASRATSGSGSFDCPCIAFACRDHGGDSTGRVFPMLYFANVPPASWHSPLAEQLPTIRTMFDALTAAHNDMAAFIAAEGRKNPSDLRAFLADRRIQIAEFLLDGNSGSTTLPPAEPTFEAWFESLRTALLVQDAADWLLSLQAWGELIRKQDPSGRFTFRFPLAGGDSWLVQASAWFAWLEQRMDLSRANVSCIITLAESAPPVPVGRLVIIVGDLQPDDVLLLTPESSTLNYVDDACKLMPVSPPMVAAPLPVTDLAAADTALAAQPAAPSQEPPSAKAGRIVGTAISQESAKATTVDIDARSLQDAATTPNWMDVLLGPPRR